MKKNKNIVRNELSKLTKITLSGLMVLTCAHFSNVSAEDTEVTEEVTVETTPTSEEITEVVEEYVEETLEETEEPTIEATPEVVEETTSSPVATPVEPTEQAVIPTEETEITGTTEITVDTDEAYEVVVPETKDEPVETEDTEVSEELKLDEMTSDELFAYIMSITSDELEALYDKYPNLDDLMANFTEEQQAQLSEKFGNAEENIEVADPRGGQGGQSEQRRSKSATFKSNISNADVVYFFWHNANDTSNVTLNSLTSAVLTIEDFASRDNQNGYIVFFVKPDANYLINGMGASGNDDIYPIGTTDFGNISRYPGLANVVKVAKDAGYVACFGYSRSYSSQESDISATITIQGQQPSVAVSATANKTTDVKPGDVITFTVTITPEVLAKTSVSNVTVTSAKINGTDVTIENLAGNTDGTYTGTVTYTVTEADCASGKVTLAVETATKYNASVTSTGQGAAISTEVTIPGSASTECSIATKSQVQYEFVSATKGKTLPSEVIKYTPSDSNTYYKGAIVNAQTPKKTTVEVNEGTWTFNGWDKKSKKMTDEGITFTGSWSFTEKKGTAGYYLALSTATWNTPTGITAYQDGDKTKYYYDKKFAKDDTFTVVSEVPTATGYEFIGWLDKERKTEGKKYAATIRQAGDTVTYIFKDDQTYTLDALWASISVTGYEGTYDGEAHTISSADIAINEGTQLDEKYIKQAKALITEGTLMYSTDNENWSDTKPTFTNAGTYTVYVREVVKLGGEEKTLVGQGTVQINPREITITAGSASKTYDGTELTENSYEITSGSLVGSDEITSVTITGSITSVGTVNNIASDAVIHTGSKDNYTVTYAPGTLEITRKVVTVTADNKTKTYGEADPTFTAKVEGTIGTDTVTYTLSREEGENVRENGYRISPMGATTQGNYKVEYVTSTLTITPRTYTVTTNSATKVYDGTALTAIGTVNGLVDGETVVFTVTGSQTEVGSSSNTYTLAWEGTAKESNYTHGTDSIGTLTITKKEEKKDDDPTPTPTPTPSVNPGCPAGTMWNEDAKTCQTIVVPVTPTVNPTPTNTPEATVTPSATPEATASAEPEKSAEPTASASAETIVDPDATPEVVTKGHWALINLIAAVVSVLLGVVLVLSKNKKDKDEDEEEQNEDEEEVKRHKRWKVVSVVDAILAVLVFIFTENMTLSMVLVDKWTMLMVLFAVVSVISLVLGRKYHEDEEDDEDKVQA